MNLYQEVDSELNFKNKMIFLDIFERHKNQNIWFKLFQTRMNIN